MKVRFDTEAVDGLVQHLQEYGAARFDTVDEGVIYITTSKVYPYSEGEFFVVFAWEGKSTLVVKPGARLNRFTLIKSGFDLTVTPTLLALFSALMGHASDQRPEGHFEGTVSLLEARKGLGEQT